MRLFNRKVMDCVIAGNGAIMYMAQPTEDLLASVERLAFMLVVDAVTGSSPQVSMQSIYGFFFAEHGWFQWNNASIIVPTSVSANTTNVLTGSLSGIAAVNGGMQGNARFFVQLTGTNASARVRAYACGRGSVRKAHRRMAEDATQLAVVAPEDEMEIQGGLHGRDIAEPGDGQRPQIVTSSRQLDRLNLPTTAYVPPSFQSRR